jgi:HEPN domain-containing protein
VSDENLWQVRIALAPEEVSALELALLAVPRERWEIRIPHVEEDSLPTLLIDVRGITRADAETEAQRLYTRARAHASLSPKPGHILGALSPLFAAAPHARLLDEAQTLIEAERFDWAVVRAQTACETYAVLALNHIARGRAEKGKDGSDLFRAVSLRHRVDRALFRDLTGFEIGAESWWTAYDLRVERRNGIVHAALSVSEEQADDSLAAAHAFIEFLQQRWAFSGRRPTPQARGPRVVTSARRCCSRR